MEKEYFNLFWFSIVTSQVLIFLCMFFDLELVKLYRLLSVTNITITLYHIVLKFLDKN